MNNITQTLKFWASFLLIISILSLTNCTPTMGEQSPTPTIVPLEEAALQTAEAERAEQIAQDANPPTPTPIPPPRSTATATPIFADNLAAQISASAPVLTTTQTERDPAESTESNRPQAEVVVGALHVRRGPGVEYGTLGAVSQNDLLPVRGIDPTGFWLQVETEDGLGWVSGKPKYTRLVGATFAELPEVTATMPPATPSSSTSNNNNITPSNPAEENGTSTSNEESSINNEGTLFFMNESGGVLYRINADGSDLSMLAAQEESPTTFMGGVIDPVVSPDGSQVAFTRWDGAEFGALFVANRDGSTERVIINDIRQPKSPTWSPDGSQILLSYQRGGLRDPELQCRYFDADDGIRIPDDATNLTVQRTGSGLKICFARREDLQWGLKLVDVATGEARDLPADLYAFTPTWHPRYDEVVYDGDKGLMRLNMETGEYEPLTMDVRDTGPVFSPDGNMLALTYQQHDHWEIYTYNMATGARQRLTKPPILADPQYNSAAPTWSPDGSQIAFVTDRTGPWEIWVMDADGSNQRPMFAPAVQQKLDLHYYGVHERMLNWTE